MRALLLSLLACTLTACSSQTAPAPETKVLERGGRGAEMSFAVADAAPPSSPTSAEQKIIRNASLSVEVEDLELAEQRAREAVQTLQGRIEAASRTGDESIHMRIRVLAGALDRALEQTASFGKVLYRQVSESDVTTQYIDVEARLKTRLALRDRLQVLLGTAESVEDILNIERELARVQGEIDAMQGQLDYLDRQVDESSLDLTLQVPSVAPPESKPGPLGYVFVGIWKAVKWLFVWED